MKSTSTHPHHTDWKFALTVFSLCIFWYSVSSASNILNKLILERFPYPLTVAMSSLFGTSLYSVPFMRKMNVPKMHISLVYLFKFIAPLACGKILAVASSYMSLWKVTVSYAHTVKATMPFFSVLCARVLLGERQSKAVYLSLVPIISGVVVASATELAFSSSGLMFALCSTFTYALLNAFVKKVLQETGLHHVKLLSLISQIACVVFLPIWCLHDVTAIWRDSFSEDGKGYLTFSVIAMLTASGGLNFAQNLITFTLIHKLTALSYAVANCTKRITIISVSLLTLRNPVTPLNMFGMFLSVIGVLGYNRAKQRTRHVEVTPTEEMSLPFSMSDPLLPDTFQSPLNDASLPFTKRDFDLSITASSNDSPFFWQREDATPKAAPRFYINSPMEEV